MVSSLSHMAPLKGIYWVFVFSPRYIKDYEKYAQAHSYNYNKHTISIDLQHSIFNLFSLLMGKVVSNGVKQNSSPEYLHFQAVKG